MQSSCGPSGCRRKTGFLCNQYSSSGSGRKEQFLVDINRPAPKNSGALKSMNRIDVIQKIIDKTGAQNYLEIGVSNGHCFLSIRARRKVAVDPKFNVSLKRKLKTIFRNWGARYYELTSDDFFARVKLPHGFEVVFIDGLHTYPQTLKDVENALRVLGKNGVIIMHDCNPLDAATAHPAESQPHAASMKLPGWTGAWMGDVWKTICHLRSQRPDLKVFVLDCDCGLGIITHGKADDVLDLSVAELQKMDYDALAKNRRQLLNLKSEDFFPELLQTL
jgi:predicted O-methyltransferase YrrM